jgi:hypothetical protein
VGKTKTVDNYYTWVIYPRDGKMKEESDLHFFAKKPAKKIKIEQLHQNN